VCYFARSGHENWPELVSDDVQLLELIEEAKLHIKTVPNVLYAYVRVMSVYSGSEKRFLANASYMIPLTYSD